MPEDLDVILARLLLALLAGGLIGFERLYRGRPAGFRTHALVCTASSLLMLLAAFQWKFVPGDFMETVRVDPTRMAQGIMTGIGFLGAGVIVKERLTVRGLTTAASIWMTAAIGIVYGLGFYAAAIAGTVVTLVVLALFQYIEQAMPTANYARMEIRLPTPDTLAETELLGVLREHNIRPVWIGYRREGRDGPFRYETVVRAAESDNFRRLARTLMEREDVEEFHISPTGDTGDA